MSRYSEVVEAARALSDEQLHEAAQGCTELTCTYHGPINQVRRERGIHPNQQRQRKDQ